MSKFQKAFTFIELMVVNAIIAVLATIAVPEYQNFVGRAQVADAVVLLTASRVDIEEYIYEAGNFPENEKFASMSTGRSGLYTKNLDVAIADTCSDAGVIEATMRFSGVSSNVAGRTFVIERDIEGNWRCARGGENSLDDRFLPKSCHVAPVPDHNFPICPQFKTGNEMPVDGGDNTVASEKNGGPKGNNGHGNNYDSVDVTNPGKSPFYDESGPIDDEIG